MNKNREHKFCEVHDNNTPILIYPDYCSGGFWCAKCGISFGDPSFYFKNIPKKLIERVDEWELLWDFMMQYENKSNYSGWNKILTRIGKRLCEEIKAMGYECAFDEDRVYLK